MDKISLPLLISLIGIATLYFPGGLIAMMSSCRDKGIDHWDWLFSVVVPFYGIAEAMVC